MNMKSSTKYSLESIEVVKPLNVKKTMKGYTYSYLKKEPCRCSKFIYSGAAFLKVWVASQFLVGCEIFFEQYRFQENNKTNT